MFLVLAVSAITTLAHHWVHKPVNITRPLEECSVVKRLLNHWMHKPVNIRRRLNSCAICMPKNAYSIFCSKAYSQLLFFVSILCFVHSIIIPVFLAFFHNVYTGKHYRAYRLSHESMYTGAVQRTNDVYCGPSFFVSHICTESAIFATTTDTLDTALTPKTKKLSKFGVCLLYTSPSPRD